MSEIFRLIDAGDIDALRELLGREPEAATARDEDGVSAVRHAAYRNPELLAVVRAAGPPLDGFDAALVGDVTGLGAPDEWSPEGFTALHLGVFGGHAEAVRRLLDAGADVNAVSRHAQIRVPPLHTAAFVGANEIARLLLERGADPNGRGELGGTALHSAAQNGNRELVRILLDHGADAGLTTDDGRTSADLAATEELASLLREHERAARE
jgi:ankyrin repeat protein